MVTTRQAWITLKNRTILCNRKIKKKCVQDKYCNKPNRSQSIRVCAVGTKVEKSHKLFLQQKFSEQIRIQMTVTKCLQGRRKEPKKVPNYGGLRGAGVCVCVCVHIPKRTEIPGN